MTASTWTDEQILTMLDLRHNEGLTSLEISERFRTSRSAIAGLLSRVEAQTEKFDADGHLNATMPRNWWKR